MKSQTDKSPSGPFSRKKLLDFLEKKAKDEKDWENIKQYVKKAPGMLCHRPVLN
jgi:tropomodulin